MKLASLTTPDLIMIDAVFEHRIDAINTLTDKLAESGKLSDKKQFLDAVMKREEEGPTALGEYLAVPHGKSEGVIEPVFACAFTKGELEWKGLDGDEPVNMIFLLAIPPAQAGSTHMEVLTTLTSSLVEDEFREALLNASTAQEVMALFGDDTNEDKAEDEAEIEMAIHPEMADDISSKAYPIVMGIGLAAIAVLFTLL
ncbi:fructose PTS transporter subunit IIA [Vibrio sp.]|nr:fructose PTS transporter subunit IIA [Vibrio sp.]